MDKPLQSGDPDQTWKWTPSEVEGRWCGLGPYYAMFPVEFVRRTVDALCPASGSVIDPFCGRGTVPFVAQATGRRALGADVNPVAWLYCQSKLTPHASTDDIISRVEEILKTIQPSDCIAENEFQKLAWHSNVLGFLNVARRVLKWKNAGPDQTLMALILVHLHAKIGEGLSNQLRQSKSMSPDYSVRWWNSKNLVAPQIDILRFFKKKLEWRYAKGIIGGVGLANVRLGDSRKVFSDLDSFKADLVLTSPPYCGVTNYEYDNWIRLWMLGGDSLPTYRQASRYSDRKRYAALIEGALAEAARLSSPNVTAYVRTDARDYTLEVTLQAILKTWPDHGLYGKFDRAVGPTQTALFGNKWEKAGEVDLLAIRPGIAVPAGFHLLKPNATNSGVDRSSAVTFDVSSMDQTPTVGRRGADRFDLHPLATDLNGVAAG